MPKRRPIIRCIYCNEERESSDEHYLPRCLGKFRGFEGLKNRICRDCNSEIGDLVERHFCRGGHVELYRKFFGIGGARRHTPSQPFTPSRTGSTPITLRAKLPGTDVPAAWEISSGRQRVRLMSRLIVHDRAGSEHCIEINKAMMQDPDLLRNELSRLDADLEGEIQCLTGPDTEEVNRLTELLAEVFPQKKSRWEQRGPSGSPFPVRVELYSGLPLARAMAKIGFHYFLKAFPECRGSELHFSGIRDFIKTGANARGPAQIAQFIQMRSSTEDIVAPLELSSEWCGHILVAGMTQSRYYAWAEFFKGFGGPGLACFVNLGENRSPLVYDLRRARRFTWFREGPDPQGYHGTTEAVSLPFSLEPPL